MWFDSRMEVVSVVIGAAVSLAGVAMTMWWTGRHDKAKDARIESAALRAEKRTAYASFVEALDAFREATLEVGEGERRKRDWAVYWEAHEGVLRSGAVLQLIAPEEMLEAASEAIDLLMDVGWKFNTHTALAFGDNVPDDLQVTQAVWNHIAVADREMTKLIDLMRIDLGFKPLTRPRPTPASAVERRTR